MSLRKCIFATVLSLYSVRAQFGPAAQFPEGMPPLDPNMAEMMLPPFLRLANETGRQDFESIITNRDLKKSEITTKLDAWANAQSKEVKEAFENDKKLQKDMSALMDGQRKRVVAGLSKQAQEVAAKIDGLRDDQDITPNQEFEKVMEIFKDVSPTVMEELRSVDAEMTPMGDAQAP